MALIPNILTAHFSVCRRPVSRRQFKEYLQSLSVTQKDYDHTLMVIAGSSTMGHLSVFVGEWISNANLSEILLLFCKKGPE